MSQALGAVQGSEATLVFGDEIIRQAGERGLDIEAVEALVEGKPVFYQFEDTPLGTYANTQIGENE